jgi:tetratricopeptide (TPR) repeat protein
MGFDVVGTTPWNPRALAVTIVLVLGQAPSPQPALHASPAAARFARQSVPPAAAGDALEEVRRLLTAAKYAEAEARARDLLAAVDGTSPSSLYAARVRDLLVQALVEGGKAADPDALQQARRAVESKESLVGAGDPEVAISLSNLGLVLRRLGKLDDAGAAYERALRIRERSLRPDHPDISRVLAALSAVANNAGNFQRARELGERALAIAQRVDPAEPLLVAVAANNLGITLFELNEHDASRSRFELALQSYERALGPDHPEVGKALSNLANVVSNSGYLAEARAMYERALRIQEQRQGLQHPDVALSLNNLAEVLFLIGDLAEARAAFERALRILEQAFGPNHNRVAMALGNLADVRSEMGDYRGSRPLYERALAIRESALGRDHPSLVYTLSGFAGLRQRLGDLAGSRDLYERAVTIAEKGFGPDSPVVAMALQGLGEVLHARGDDSAGDRLSRALAIRRNLLGQEHPLVAETQVSLALVQAASGDRAAALENALEAERVARAHLQITAQALPERQALAYAARRVSGRDLALSLVTASSGAEPSLVFQTWDAVVRSRAVILEEMASRRRLVAATSDREIGRLAAELSTARQRLAGLLVRSAADPASRQLVAEAARAREAAEQKLAEGSLDFRRQQAERRLGLSDAVAALPAQGMLVAFVRYTREASAAADARPGSQRSTTSRAVPAYLAFVIRAGSTMPLLVPLGDAKRIDDAVDAWRRGIVTETYAGRPTARMERVHRASGEALRRLVWDPIASAVEGARHVFVVPDGSLHLVNFAALPRRGGGYLIENSALLHYLSSERDLTYQPAQTGDGLLLVDNPAYGGTGSRASALTASGQRRRSAVAAVDLSAVSTSCEELQKLRFESLPGTKREADEIAQLWTSSRAGPEASSATDKSRSCG